MVEIYSSCPISEMFRNVTIPVRKSRKVKKKKWALDSISGNNHLS